MPKVTKIADNKYEYTCACGCEVTYETDDKKIKKVKKCFKCQEKITEDTFR